MLWAPILKVFGPPLSSNVASFPHKPPETYVFSLHERVIAVDTNRDYNIGLPFFQEAGVEYNMICGRVLQWTAWMLSLLEVCSPVMRKRGQFLATCGL
jgi:hypothetical protein